MDLPPVLTVNEAAQLLRTSRMTIKRLIDSGELDGIKVGAQLRVLSSSLPALRIQPTPATPRHGADRSDRRPVAA
jgi:excisionase family DNA binding protein